MNSFGTKLIYCLHAGDLHEHRYVDMGPNYLMRYNVGAPVSSAVLYLYQRSRPIKIDLAMSVDVTFLLTKVF